MQYKHPNTVSDDAFEVVEITTNKTYCDGSAGALGHPRVFLKIEEGADRVTCPYCSKMFLYVS